MTDETTSPRYRIKLSSDEHDARDLLDLYGDERLPYRIIHDDGEYWLESPAFDEYVEAHDAYEAATIVLGRMNAHALLVHRDHRPVAAAGIRDRKSGTGTTLFISGSAVVRTRVRAAALVLGSAQLEQPLHAPDYLTLAASSDHVMHALDLLAAGDTTWVNLYRLFEIIEADAAKQMYSAEWLSKKQISRFTGTVNSFRAIGKDARHAKLDKEPMKDPISHKDATDLILGLAQSWLNWRAGLHRVNQFVQAEYAQLCSRLSLTPVPLVCTTNPTGTEPLGSYGNSPPQMTVAVDIQDTTSFAPFPPSIATTEMRLGELATWPTWRTNLWHECVHQALHQLQGFGPDQHEDGWDDNGTRINEPDHGRHWREMVEHFAAEFGLIGNDLDRVLMGNYYLLRHTQQAHKVKPSEESMVMWKAVSDMILGPNDSSGD